MEAGRNNVIDGEIFGLLGELVKNVKANPKPKSTIKSTSSKPNVPQMAPKLNGLPQHLQPRPIDPIVQVKPNSDPSAVPPHPDVSFLSAVICS